jgi:hypothetical protein
MADDGYVKLVTTTEPPGESVHSHVPPTAPLATPIPGAGGTDCPRPAAMPRAADASSAEISSQAFLLVEAALVGGGACVAVVANDVGDTAEVACPGLALVVIPPHAAILNIVAAITSLRFQLLYLPRLVIADCFLPVGGEPIDAIP